MSSATCSGGSAGSGQCVDGYHPRQCGGLVQGGELSYGEGTKGRRASDPATPPDAEPRPRSRTPSRSAVVTNTSRSAVGLARSQPRWPEPGLPTERLSSEQMSLCKFLPGLRVHSPERKCPGPRREARGADGSEHFATVASTSPAHGAGPGWPNKEQAAVSVSSTT
jgi:hypothetical protein